MKLSEFIRDMQQLAGEGNDPEVILFDIESHTDFVLRPDEGPEGRFDFQITRGDDQIVLEF